MKIRESLLPEGKNLNEDEAMIKLEIVSPFEAAGLKEQIARAYIELDTGGILDNLSERRKEIFRKIIGMYLARFANYLLAAIEFDMTISQKGESETHGYQSIEDGMRLISESLNKIRVFDTARA